MNFRSQKTATILAPCVNVHDDITECFGEKKTSNASDRYQVEPLLKALQNLEISTRVFSLNKNYDIQEIDTIPQPSLCIVAKMRSHPTLNDPNKYAQFHLCTALTLKRNGAKLMTLYSDNVIANGSYDAELYKNLLYFSDCIITPTEEISSYAKQWAGSNTVIKRIRDPILIKEQPFEILDENRKCNLIWFGHNQNFNYLEAILPQLIQHSSKDFFFELTILGTHDTLRRVNKAIYPSLPKKPNWQLRLVPWQIHNQPEQLEQELGRAHISLLPSNPKDPLKRGASHNRLTDSIQSGCIPLASPLPAYLELSELCLIGNNFSELLDLAINNNYQYCHKFSQSRGQLLKQFSRKQNIIEWEQILSDSLQT